MAEEAFTPGMDEGCIPGAGEAAGDNTFFESVKTSLPGLDMFDPSVFDIRMVLAVLGAVGLIAYGIFRLFVRKVVGEDDFFSDLGISYKDFDMPDEVDDYYEAKEDPEIFKDKPKLRNALLKRAIADIPIILRMQNEGPGIYNMYQQAMIGEREWHAFQEAETMISEEIESVQTEADGIEEGWSTTIWPLAMQLRSLLLQRREQAEKDGGLVVGEKASSTKEKGKDTAVIKGKLPPSTKSKEEGNGTVAGAGAGSEPKIVAID